MGGDNDLKPVAPHSLGKFNADLVSLLWRNLTVLEALEAVIADNLTRVAPSRFGKASAGYILPADKQATVKVNATAIVQMHNEFRDTPKTGDDFNLGLWVSLAALSVVGAGVLGFVGYKNRKKKKED